MSDKESAESLLYVSSVDCYKHQWHVVEALARLIAKGHTDLRLRLVGWLHGPSVRRLQKTIARLDMASYVELWGPMSSSELPGVYHSASLFIFASSCENCPMTLLEAMASGLPIACSNRPPMSEFAEDGVCYFDPEDSVSIASAVGNILEDKSLRRDKARRAYELSLSYGWERCARETFTLLKEVGHRVS